MTANHDEHRGLPIYLDDTPRSVTDALATAEIDTDDWFPSNSAAHKLWRCLEAMRDLDELLEDSAEQKNATKRKRKLKIAVTPLHSFILAIGDLCNDIQSNKETKSRLTGEQLAEIQTIKASFAELLPHDHKAPITTIRNKLSSHIDKKLYPRDAQQIAGAIKPHEFGRWLHICLHLILDLTKLNIYAWACRGPSDEYDSLMTNEPYIAKMKLSDDGSELVGLNVASDSPRNAVPEVANRLIIHSQWMFKAGQPRIARLKEDSREKWNTFSGNLDMHRDIGSRMSVRAVEAPLDAEL
jgi:hypothetical protein